MKCTLGRLWCVSNKMSFKKGTQGKCNALTAIQFLSVHMAPSALFEWGYFEREKLNLKNLPV